MAHKMTLPKLLRVSRNLKVSDILPVFEKKTGLGRLTYHNIENGYSAANRQAQLAIAKSLGVKSTKLFDKNGKAKEIKEKHLKKFVKIVNPVSKLE